MAELSFTEKNKSLVAVLRAGKEIYQQEKQNLFVPEVEVAVTTSSSLTDGLVSCLKASRNTRTCKLNGKCPHENLNERGNRGRPKFLIPKEQLKGLRSLGFCLVSISDILSVSEKNIETEKDRVRFMP